MEAPKINFVLSDKVLANLCSLYQLDPVQIEHANALGFLNVHYIRDIMVRYDYDQLTKGVKYIQTVNKVYSYQEIKFALAKAYSCTPAEIEAILKNKNNKNMRFCKRCGRRITAKTGNRTDDLCIYCHAEELDL